MFPIQGSREANQLLGWLLVAFFLIAYVLPLGARDLLVPDETRYAEIPREMIASGDWVVPHLNGVRYFEKPVLGYWLHAGSLLLFGQNRFAVRLPSALAAGLSALLLFFPVFQTRREDDRERVGTTAFLTALVFLSCFEVFGVGNTALLDSLFALWVTGTIVAFFLATEKPPGSASEKGLLLLTGVACGLAFLTKGFLAVALPVLVLAPYLIWQGRYRDLLRMSWLPLLIAVLVTLPWSILIHLREPDFWHYFFWVEHFRRFLETNAQHRRPFWFFFATAPGLFLPWTFMIPAALIGIRKRLHSNTPEGRLLRLAACWLVLPFLFFSASKGKLLTYILPCFPPFSLLMALGLSHLLAKGKNKAFQVGAVAAALFFALLLVGLILLQTFGYQGFRLYSHPQMTAMAIIGLAGLVFSCFWSARSRNATSKVILLGLAPLLLYFGAHFAIPDLVVEESAPGRLLARHHDLIQPGTVLIADKDVAGAVCWTYKRDDVYVLGSPGELDYGLRYRDASGRLLDLPTTARLIADHPGQTVLVARAKRFRDQRASLPRPTSEDDSGPEGFVLLTY